MMRCIASAGSVRAERAVPQARAGVVRAAAHRRAGPWVSWGPDERVLAAASGEAQHLLLLATEVSLVTHDRPIGHRFGFLQDEADTPCQGPAPGVRRAHTALSSHPSAAGVV